MKCKSCQSEINPQWKHAITNNICPFCGDNVIEEHLKKLFSSLHETMESLKEYSNELNDWMLSNYQFIKTDSPLLSTFLPSDIKYVEKPKEVKTEEIKKYTVKVQTEQGEQEVVAEKIQSEEKTNEFFKRAEAVKPNIDGFSSTAEKTQHLKNIAQQIKKAGSQVVKNNVSANAASFVPTEMLEQADPEAVAELQSMLAGGEEITSALPNNNGDEEIPDIVLAMANQSKGSGSSTTNAADLKKLQQMQQRVQNSRKNFESGENRGKGGFSRSG